ncbi:hypothetical protein QBC36DRAFT_222146 [Triangularia setosa]|uniref:Uncharacterized protein n=1 Tax=Triangularia setosa TaxID=2587417 RepID=A0AAN7A521_9PEZI|nr:hypothetical protein QBC36DRAFT_222146 [Podospora setosa]
MVNLRDLLLQPPLPNGTSSFHRLPGAGKPSLSHKNWAREYPEVQNLRLHVNPTEADINEVFGSEDALDEYLLNKEGSPLNVTTEWLQTEGDSVRTFYTKVAKPIQLAVQPFITLRSESGPLGPTNVNQTIDFTWGCGEHCLVIGELKRHGMIDVETWTGRAGTDSNRTWLGKELRGYCHKYKCFAGTVFDGQHLLTLIFQAQTARNIREQNCEVIGLLFSRDHGTLRYGLFRTLTHQIRRMQADRAPAVNVDGYFRGFEWWSGIPYWVDGNGEHEAHPNGYIRLLDPSGAWYWADANGNPVLYQDGQRVWDTLSLG